MLLLLFQPGVTSSPTPPDEEPATQFQGGGGVVSAHHLMRKKRIEQDEADLIELLGVVVPLIARRG